MAARSNKLYMVLTPEERAALEALAARRGSSMMGVLRTLMLDEARRVALEDAALRGLGCAPRIRAT